MDSAFQYAIDVGLNSETAYPYTAVRGKCVADTKNIVVRGKGFTDVATSSVSALQAALAKGPVAVAIEADQLYFQLYTGGVMGA